MELKRIRRDIRDLKPVQTPVYNSSLHTPTLYLLTNEAFKQLSRTIGIIQSIDIKGSTLVENPKDMIRKLRRRITQTIKSLEKEYIGFPYLRIRKTHVHELIFAYLKQHIRLEVLRPR